MSDYNNKNEFPEGTIKLDEQLVRDLNGIKAAMDVEFKKFVKLVADTPELSTGAVTALAVTRDSVTGLTGLTFAFGDNVFCYCDPPGISLPCDDLKKYGCGQFQ